MCLVGGTVHKLAIHKLTERAVFGLVGGSDHGKAGADPAAPGEADRRVHLGHGFHRVQGGKGEVVHVHAGLRAGAVLGASALEATNDVA